MARLGRNMFVEPANLTCHVAAVPAGARRWPQRESATWFKFGTGYRFVATVDRSSRTRCNTPCAAAPIISNCSTTCPLRSPIGLADPTPHTYWLRSFGRQERLVTNLVTGRGRNLRLPLPSPKPGRRFRSWVWLVDLAQLSVPRRCRARLHPCRTGGAASDDPLPSLLSSFRGKPDGSSLTLRTLR